MQAATGELNLTLITVVALGLLLALFTGFMWPSIKEKLKTGWDNTGAAEDDLNLGGTGYNFSDYVESELF